MSRYKLVSAIAKAGISPPTSPHLQPLAVSVLPAHTGKYDARVEDAYIHNEAASFLMNKKWLDSGAECNETATPRHVGSDDSKSRVKYDHHRQYMFTYSEDLKTLSDSIKGLESDQHDKALTEAYLKMCTDNNRKRLGLTRLGYREQDMPRILAHFRRLLAIYQQNPDYPNLLFSTHDLFKIVTNVQHAPYSAKTVYYSGLLKRYDTTFANHNKFTLPLIYFHQLIGSTNINGSHAELMKMFDNNPRVDGLTQSVRNQLKEILSDEQQKKIFFDCQYLFTSCDIAGASGEGYLSLHILDQASKHAETLQRIINAEDPLVQVKSIANECTEESFQDKFANHLVMFTARVDDLPVLKNQITSLWDNARNIIGDK
ncbi:MAG: hypothetical protein AABZ14_04815, partial [Candidatus Margulisiibacteriota bacterium]